MVITFFMISLIIRAIMGLADYPDCSEKPICATVVVHGNHSGEEDFDSKKSRAVRQEKMNRRRADYWVDYADYIRRRGF